MTFPEKKYKYLDIWKEKIDTHLAKFEYFASSQAYLFEAVNLIKQLQADLEIKDKLLFTYESTRTPKKIDSEDLLLDLQEAICDNIDEPAGPRCGYGITEAGQSEMQKIVERFITQNNQ